MARDTEPGEALQAPPPQLWDRIAAATGVSATMNGLAPGRPALNGSAAPAEPSAVLGTPVPPASPEHSRTSWLGRRRGAWPRGRLAGATAGLAAGLVIGI